MIQTIMIRIAVLVLLSNSSIAAQTLYPAKDGTLADGGIFGAFDGLADDADWYFNQSSYEGSVSRSVSAPGVGLEHRIIWEYSLTTVTLTPPVDARLEFTLRGAPVFPMPDVAVHVYTYPADLAESLADFSATPAVLQGVVTVQAFQAPTAFNVDVSAAVNAALSSGARKVAFRFQVNPGTSNPTSQVYMDAVDSDVTTKPKLSVQEGIAAPGDIDGDGDVDTDDFLGFPPCMSGPDVAPTVECAVYDFDTDSDVDLGDYQAFQDYVGTEN